MRLDKYLSDAGACARKEVAALVRAGRVTIDGKTAKSASDQVTEKSQVCLDRKAILRQTQLYLMMNKPAGVLTAARDKNAPTVADYLPKLYEKRGASPVGRLDKDVTGLLIFTTDGELNHRLTSPKRGVEKLYQAHVDGALEKSDIAAFAQGLDLGDFTAQSAKLEILDAQTARVTVCEGKFHQVKRMFEKVGKPVLTLRRLSMGGVWIDESLAPGQTRELTPDEIALLRKSAGMEEV